MDDNADAKRILLASPPADWRRQLGHPCITWLSTIQQDLKQHHLTLREAADLAQNRPLRRMMSTYGATQSWVACQKRWRLWCDWPSTWLTNRCPSVLWHYWLGYLTRKIVSEMTYNVSHGMLNPTMPMALCQWNKKNERAYCLRILYSVPQCIWYINWAYMTTAAWIFISKMNP